MQKILFCKIKHLSLSFLIPVLLFCCALAIISSLKLGFIFIDWQTIVSVFLNNVFNIHSTGFDPDLADIILKLRLPRILLAACVGMGLTLSGIIMQAIVKNPLADPYILGISSGASLGATIAIFLGLGSLLGTQAVGICAFIGALVISSLVIFISNMGSANNSVKLLLSGLALSAVCSSLSGFTVYLDRSKEGMESITYWLMGNVANAKLTNVLLLLLLILFIFLYFLSQIRILNLMLIGNESAMTLGIDLNKYIPKYLLLNGLLVGFIVFNAGTIGFIGLLIPHIVRTLFGANHHKTLPVAVLTGGLFAVIMDILSRTLIRGVDIPIGIIFALVGAPCFIYLMLQKSYRFGGN